MNTDVVWVTPEQDVTEAAALMAERDIGCVPVVENGRLEGILTDRDIVVRCLAVGRDPMLCPSGEVCTRSAAYVYADQTAEDALALMAAEQVRRLPVMDRGRLVGMVSLGDLAKRDDWGAETAEALAEIVTPYRFYS